MIILIDPSGPKIDYNGVIMNITDLNPEVKIRWRMTRWELLKFGIRSIFAAFFAGRGQ